MVVDNMVLCVTLNERCYDETEAPQNMVVGNALFEQSFGKVEVGSR
jgi:hypothetical protein